MHFLHGRPYTNYLKEQKMAILTINSCSTSPMHPNDTMIVLDKFTVDTWLYESVQDRLNEILPYLLKGRDYTWQELLGEGYLADMAIPRHLPTLCLKHLAQQPGSQLTVMPLTGSDTTFFEI